MMQLFKKYRYVNWITIIVILLVVFRLVLNATVPLMDKTEARYAEIARIMVDTNNWIVPQISNGIPFWAKPPLSTWLSASSFKLFGMNEFAARFPYFLLSILMALMLGKYAKREQLSFWLPALILFTIPQFYLHAGVVSTDTALAFSVALTMLSFWESTQGSKHWYWKYLFFVGISLGLLAKGPIILILTIPPLFIWIWIHNYFKRVWLLFPWFSGAIIIALIGLPWYYFAEKESPGFIDYFIVGEHFKRFFDSGWSGDKYGFPKSQPVGMIWVFLLIFSFPWIQIIISKIIKNRKSILKNKWITFLGFWLLWTPLFFTSSKSLIHPYIMPVMVPLALLIVHWWKDLKYKKIALTCALLVPVASFGIYSYALTTNQLKFYANSDKQFVEKIQNELPTFHLYVKSYSGQFYSKGKIEVKQLHEIENYVHDEKPFEIIIKNRDTSTVPATILNRLEPIDFTHKKTFYRFKGKDNNNNIVTNENN